MSSTSKMSECEKRITQAVTNIVFQDPFYATLLMRLERIVDNSQPTMATDGIRLLINEEFVEYLSAPELEGVLVHEVLHCALNHPWRCGGRDVTRWQQAIDYVVNPIVLENYKLPDGHLFDKAYVGMPAEQVYELLPATPPGERKGQGNKNGSSSGKGGTGQGQYLPEMMGAVQEPEAAESIPSLQADWDVAVIQAANAAKMAGNLPTFAKRLVEQIRKPKVDWRSVLRRFVQETAKADYTWKQPSPRYLPLGIYLPSLRSESMRSIVIGVDTSGSIDQSTLDKFATEMQSIIDECRPEKTYVMWWDTLVNSIDVFEQDEPLVLNPKGGGGTKVADVFNRIEKNCIDPACTIILTDMYIFDLDSIQQPEYPVIWCSTTEGTKQPFGEQLFIGEE